MDESFPAACHLKKAGEIKAVFDHRDVHRGERLVFYRAPRPSVTCCDEGREKPDEGGEPTPCHRFCLMVSRKCGGAVRRNRIKRILREIIRHNRHRILEGWDYIIRVDPDRLPNKIISKDDFFEDFAAYFGWK